MNKEKELRRKVTQLRVELAKGLLKIFQYDIKRLNEDTVVIKPLVAKAMNKQFVEIVTRCLKPINYEFMVDANKELILLVDV